MSATLSSELDNTDKLYEFYQDCLHNKLNILPPNINLSNYRFTPIGKTDIIYGMGAIKGVGLHAATCIIEERNKNGLFKGFINFCRRLDRKVINKKTLESLVKAGCFDCFDTNRAKYFNEIPKVLNDSHHIVDNINQGSLFDDFEDEMIIWADVSDDTIANIEPWVVKQLLQMEKQALGYYFSASLFDEYKEIVKQLNMHPLNYYSVNNEEMQPIINSGYSNRNKPRALICGVVNKLGSKALKKGGKMYFVNIEDDSGECEFIIFNDEYDEYKHLIKVDSFIFIEGTVMYDSFREQIKITAHQIFNLDEILANKIKQVNLNINHEIDLSNINNLFAPNGHATVKINYFNKQANCKLQFGGNYKFIANYENINRLSSIQGITAWNLEIVDCI